MPLTRGTKMVVVLRGSVEGHLPGDVLSLAVGNDGWWVDRQLYGMSTGGTYDFALSGTPKETLTLTSLGFDAACAATTVARTIFGTHEVFKAYPDQLTTQETASAGNVTGRGALSDYVFQQDTGISGAILAGLYTQGSQNRASAGLVVTNNSTVAYPNVIMRFLTMPYKRLTGAFVVECQAFQRFGRNGKPLAAVKFTLTDGIVTRTHIVTAMTLSTDADQLPVYACEDDASNFTQGANVTCQIQGYPWVGDASSVADSSLNAWQNTGMALANLPVGVCDKDDTYGVTYCAVDATLGNDTTGVAANSEAAALLAPVQHISKAYKKIQDFNNANYSRNTVDAGQIRLVGGGHLFGIGNENIATHSACACTITRATGTAKGDAIITGGNADSKFGSKVTLLYDMTTEASSAPNQTIAFVWDNAPLLFEDVTITGADGNQRLVSCNTDGKAAIMAKNVVMTRYNSGLCGGNDANALLARSCSVSGNNNAPAYQNCRAVVGCEVLDPNNNAVALYGYSAGAWEPASQNIIVSYSEAYAMTGNFMSGLPQNGCTIRDVAFVCCLGERVGATNGEALMEMSGANIHNVLNWHLTMVGDRYNAEGDVTGGPGTGTDRDYELNAFRFCSLYYLGTHSPGDAHAENGLLTGQWPYSDFCVGTSDSNTEITPNVQAPRFLGMRVTEETAAGYVDDKSKTGDDAGGGDYHPDVGSALLNRVPAGAAVVPFDLNRVAIPNDGTGAIGALQAA